MKNVSRRGAIRGLCAGIAVLWALSAAASTTARPEMLFESIDGGTIDLDSFRGRPVLVANTASLCAFTPQYDDLQTLFDRYRDAGLVVVAVPSDDFRQELGSDAEVRDFCAMTFGLDLPMTVITPVRGEAAHPFYRWLRDSHGVTPRWNFHKVLLARDGSVAGDWPAAVNPMSAPITDAVEAALAG